MFHKHERIWPLLIHDLFTHSFFCFAKRTGDKLYKDEVLTYEFILSWPKQKSEKQVATHNIIVLNKIQGSKRLQKLGHVSQCVHHSLQHS